MNLTSKSYGKARVRVLRRHRDGDRHEVRETTLKATLAGDFGRAFTGADNSTTVATDSIKNIVNVVARENLRLDKEEFGIAIVKRFLDRYAQVETVAVEVVETVWRRLSFDGREHGHSFTKDGNGHPVARVRGSRSGIGVEAGVEGFTFMKTTGSGWANYVNDEFTTLPETEDRIAATSMDAAWRYARAPSDYAAAGAAMLHAMLEVFATTYSAGVQDSMYRMGCAALEAVPEVAGIRIAMPNKHYIPIDLSPFGLDNPGAVFLPTDEPHGQIDCTVERG